MKVSLKTQNIAPLSTLVLLQLLAIIYISYGYLDKKLLSEINEAGGAILAIGSLAALMSYLMSAEMKSKLIFLRLNHALPGHRFIQLANADPRIEKKKFKRSVDNYDALVSDHVNQNSYWYNEFYRPVINHNVVASTHRSYLLYRDAAVVSLLLGITFAVAKLAFKPVMADLGYINLFVFSAAFGCFLLAGQNAGKRLVTSAIAIRLSE
ncbi:MAG: hypothetical protein RPS47_12995 [Colwellia sp.]